MKREEQNVKKMHEKIKRFVLMAGQQGQKKNTINFFRKPKKCFVLKSIDGIFPNPPKKFIVFFFGLVDHT